LGVRQSASGSISISIVPSQPLALWRTPKALELIAAIESRIQNGNRLAVATLLRRGEENADCGSMGCATNSQEPTSRN